MQVIQFVEKTFTRQELVIAMEKISQEKRWASKKRNSEKLIDYLLKRVNR